MSEETKTNRCPKCEGCGQVADNQERTAWARWLDEPHLPESGLVQPMPCPKCFGTGARQVRKY